MKYFIFIFLFPLLSNAQIITSIAGGGSTLGDGGIATTAVINDPVGIIFSKEGYFYIASGVDNRIRKIDTFGIITTIAGTGAVGYSGDGGLATAAKIHFATGIALDTSGNIFFADGLNHAIRKIDINTRIITTICGNGISGYSGDNGPASIALLNTPEGISFDKFNNLYISEDNHTIRKINTSGIISTIAGNGIAGYNGDGIPASSAQLYFPMDVTVDDTGNVYIADQGNYRIRKINTSGIISTYAGNGGTSYAGDGIAATAAQLTPTMIKFDSLKILYVTSDHRISKIDHSGVFHTVAGNGMATNTGDGGPATAASLYEPVGLAFDKCNNLYTSVINYNRIRKVTFNPACSLAQLNTEIANIPENISIYPNPVNVELQIENALPNTEYKLCNVVGMIKQHGHLQQGDNTVSLRQLTSGMYMLVLIDEKGRKTVKKIVKE